jgi:CheY-specific phosphatase CheX
MCSIDMNDARTRQSCGIFMMCFDNQTILKILATYGMAETADEKIIGDAAEEIVNMIFGMAKTSLSKRGYNLSMEFPTSLPMAMNAG